MPRTQASGADRVTAALKEAHRGHLCGNPARWRLRAPLAPQDLAVLTVGGAEHRVGRRAAGSRTMAEEVEERTRFRSRGITSVGAQ